MGNKQLFEKESNSYKPIYPLVRLEDIIDTISDKSIQWILNNYNHIYVEYSESVAVTRNKVPQLLRRTGLWISYNAGTEVVTEYYKGDNKDVTNFIKWTNNDNWERFDKIKHLDGSITYQHLSESLRQLIGQGNNITNFPDDEDLEVKDGLLKLKDRDFEPNNFSGLGRVILRKNIKAVDGHPKNVLTQDMINKENTIYEIRYDFDLGGQDLTLADNSYIEYNGGSIINGTILDAAKGMNKIVLKKNIVNGKNILIQELINKPNTIYIIQYNYDLNGSEITIPEGCVLDFQGGSLSNGTIFGDNTLIKSLPSLIFSHIILKGSWVTNHAYSQWFEGNNINECLDAFYKVTIIGDNVVTKSINCLNKEHRYTIEFTPNSRIIASSDFEGDYIIIAGPCKEHPYLPSKNIYDIYIHGVGEPHIDCNGVTGILKTEPSSINGEIGRNLFMTNIRVVNAYDINGKVQDGMFLSNLGNHITNCIFESARIDNSKDYGAMIYAYKTDNIFNNVVIVTSKIGLYCGDSCILSNIHVWGAPDVAVQTSGSTIITNLYGDWAKVGVKYNGSAPANLILDNYYLVTSDSPESDRYIEKCSVLQISNSDVNASISYFSAYDKNPIPVVDSKFNPISSPRILIINKNNALSIKENLAFNYNNLSIGGGSGYYKFLRVNLNIVNVLTFIYTDGYNNYVKFLIKNINDSYFLIEESSVSKLSYNTISCYKKDIGGGVIELCFKISIVGAKLFLDTSNIPKSGVTDRFIFYGDSIDESYLNDFELLDVINTSGTQNPNKAPCKGFQYFNTSLNKPVWWTGEKWVDATGAEV